MSHVLGKLYSIMHDGVQKHSRELNGVMVRHTSTLMDPLTTPWSLTEIQGGSLNALKLCEHIINTIRSVHPVKDPADASLLKALSKHHRSIDIPLAPSYFKVCQLIHFSEDTKTIQLIMPNWPIAITADGCSTNMAAGDKLVDKLGLPTPFMRYDFCILISLIYCLALI